MIDKADVGAGAVITTVHSALDAVEVSDAEQKLSRTLSRIHAVARHILGAEAETNMSVGIQPLGSRWSISVKLYGFSRDVARPSLQDAMDAMLSTLMSEVALKVEEGERMLDALRPTRQRATATVSAIEEELRRMPGVAGVVLKELESFPPVVEVTVSPLKVQQTFEERDQLAFDVGFTIAKCSAVGLTLGQFRVTIAGFVKT